MRLVTEAPAAYLAADAVVDWEDEGVQAQVCALRAVGRDPVRYAEQAFLFTRDHIQHSGDVGDRRVTLTASEVLHEGVGLCFGKSHLLVGLLRAAGIPAGLCYQRLADDDGRFSLHGLVAVFLQGRWSRLDPRGNKPGVDAQFALDGERLAWPVRPDRGEVDYPTVLAASAPAVVEALTRAADMLALCAGGLPDRLVTA